MTAEEFLSDVQPQGMTAEQFLSDVQTPKATFKSVASEFGKGAGRTASMGTQNEFYKPSPLAGSVFEPTAEKWARRAGEFTGSIAPLIIAARTGGKAAASMEGVGAMGEAAATGMTLAAMQGAAQNKPINEQLSDIATQGALFAGLGAVGKGLGYLRRIFGESLPESLANYFLNTPKKIATDIFVSGKPSLGRQVLDSPELGASFSFRKTIYNKAQAELGNLENQIQNKLQDLKESAMTPNVPEVNVPANQRALPYLPTETWTPSETNPVQTYPGGRKAGERVMLGPVSETTQPGGVTYQTLRPGVGTPLDYAGRTFEPTFPPSNIRAMDEGLNPQPSHMAAPVKKGPAILTQDITSSLDNLISRKQSIGDIAGARKIDIVRQNFAKANPEFLDIQQANQIRRVFDKEVNDAFLSQKELPVKTQVYETMANSLRDQIADKSPELADLLSKQHLMLNVSRSLLPSIVEGAQIPIQPTLFGTAENMARSSPVSLGMAGVLNSPKVLGTPSTVIAPIARMAAQAATNQVNPSPLTLWNRFYKKPNQ